MKRTVTHPFPLTDRELIALRRLLYEEGNRASREYSREEAQHTLALERVYKKIAAKIGYGGSSKY